MYDRKYSGGRTLKARFKDGVEEFVTYAMSQDIVNITPHLKYLEYQ